MSCKKVNVIAQHNRIFEHINIRTFERRNSLSSWRREEEVSNFLKCCKDCGNPEALYNEGMQCFFEYDNSKLGLQYLKMTISKGPPTTTYVYGVILVCHEGDSKKKGLKLLHSPNGKKLVVVMDCREEARQSFSSIWVDKEVKGRIIKLHDDDTATTTCIKCLSDMVLSHSDALGLLAQ